MKLFPEERIFFWGGNAFDLDWLDVAIHLDSCRVMLLRHIKQILWILDYW